MCFLIIACKGDEPVSVSPPNHSGGPDTPIDVPDLTENSNTISSITTYGGTKNDGFNSVCSTTDGGYAVLGFTQSNDGDVTGKIDESFDYWVLKFSQDNLLEWSKTFGGSNDDRGSKLIQTSDDGYLLVGYSRSADGDLDENQGLKDVFVLKLDVQGDVMWKRSFGFIGNDQGISVIEAANGDYLIGASLDVTASEGLGNDRMMAVQHAGGDYWVIRLNTSGDTLWRKYYGGGQTETLNAMIQTQGGGFLLVGDSDSEDVDINGNIGTYDFWLVKIDGLGNMLWEKSFGGTEIEKCYAVAESANGDYLILGDTRSSDADVSNLKGNADVWALSISSDGDKNWQKTYGGSSFDSARSVVKSVFGGFYIAGSSRSMTDDVTENKGQNDIWVLKISDNGSVEWQESVGGGQIDFAYGITQLEDGSVVVVGDTLSEDGDFPIGRGFKDAFIIKIK